MRQDFCLPFSLTVYTKEQIFFRIQNIIIVVVVPVEFFFEAGIVVAVDLRGELCLGATSEALSVELVPSVGVTVRGGAAVSMYVVWRSRVAPAGPLFCRLCLPPPPHTHTRTLPLANRWCLCPPYPHTWHPQCDCQGGHCAQGHLAENVCGARAVADRGSVRPHRGLPGHEPGAPTADHAADGLRVLHLHRDAGALSCFFEVARAPTVTWALRLWALRLRLWALSACVCGAGRACRGLLHSQWVASLFVCVCVSVCWCVCACVCAGVCAACVLSLQEVCSFLGCIDLPVPDFCPGTCVSCTAPWPCSRLCVCWCVCVCELCGHLPFCGACHAAPPPPGLLFALSEIWFVMVEIGLSPIEIPLFKFCFVPVAGNLDKPTPSRNVKLVQFGTEVELTWDACQASSVVDKYTVCLGTRPGGEDVAACVDVGSAKTHTLSGFAHGALVYGRVTCTTSQGTTAETVSSGVLMDLLPPYVVDLAVSRSTAVAGVATTIVNDTAAVLVTFSVHQRCVQSGLAPVVVAVVCAALPAHPCV